MGIDNTKGVEEGGFRRRRRRRRRRGMKIILVVLIISVSCTTRMKRVVHGIPTPWTDSSAIVSLESSYPHERSVTLCGGTIIAPRVIITAAHCVFNDKIHKIASTVRVRVAFNRTSPHEGKTFLTNDILIHPQYIPARFPAAFDLAMILLSIDDELSLCDFVTSPQLARLPSSQLDFVDFKNEKCYTVGWGKMENNRYSGVPQHANIINVNETPDYHFRATVIQGIGEGDQRACFGDSGGPLICEIDHIPYLIGVSSEIHSDNTIDSSIPLESSRRCVYSKKLHAVDIRKQMRTILSLLASRGLLHSMIDSQNECFRRNE